MSHCFELKYLTFQRIKTYMQPIYDTSICTKQIQIPRAYKKVSNPLHRCLQSKYKIMSKFNQWNALHCKLHKHRIAWRILKTLMWPFKPRHNSINNAVTETCILLSLYTLICIYKITRYGKYDYKKDRLRSRHTW